MARAATSQIKVLVRANWSTPPTHGALIVAGVLNTPALRQEWMDNIRTMSTRIALMRKLLKAALEAKKCPGSWQHIVDQIGMFSFTGLTRGLRKDSFIPPLLLFGLTNVEVVFFSLQRRKCSCLWKSITSTCQATGESTCAA